LLDTNTCIQLWQRKNLRVRKQFFQYNPDELALCSVAKAELLFGALHSKQKEHNLQLLHSLRPPDGFFHDAVDDRAGAQAV
jgi:tRNA(fMet)-specific endonuclease VapC